MKAFWKQGKYQDYYLYHFHGRMWRGEEQDFCWFPMPPLPDPWLPKSQGLWVDRWRQDRQTDRDLSGWKGRGENGRLQLTAPLPWATGVTAHGSGRVILHSFYSVWKNLAAPRKQTLGMICSYLLFVCVKGWLCRRAHKECLWSE